MKLIISLLMTVLVGLPSQAWSLDARLEEHMQKIELFAGQGVDFHDQLKSMTAVLFEDYRHIVEMQPGPETEKTVEALTHIFAKDFESWSLEVARATNGENEAFRMRVHRSFCLSIFQDMTEYAPGHNPPIEREFRKDFLNELAALEPQQEARVISLFDRFWKRTSRISVTEGMAAIAIAATLFQVVQQKTGNWIDADIGGFAGFLGTLEILKDLVKPRPDRELIAQRVALAFNNDARRLCEEHFQPKH
jgi:hypothetical protein